MNIKFTNKGGSMQQTYSISYESNGERCYLTEERAFSKRAERRALMDFQTALRECEYSRQHGHPKAEIVTE